MNKLCPSCEKLLEYKCFSKHSKKKDGLQVYCKKCMKDKNAFYYKNGYNKKQNEHNRKNRDKIKKLIQKVKSDNPCPCGESDFTCLDFHHLFDNKEKAISAMMSNTFGLSNVIDEIEKCCVLCSNCHRKLHGGSDLPFDIGILKCLKVRPIIDLKS